MKKNENNSVGCRALSWNGLFNRIKNSLKKFSKKSLGKAGLFLVFGMIILNLSILNGDVGLYNIASAQETKPLLTIIMEKLNSMGLFFDRDSEVLKGSAAIGEVLSTNPFSLVMKGLLWGLIVALGQLLKGVSLLFDLVIDQDFFRALIDNEGLYTGWVIVRDMLNMFFMLLLLFSAFATIFQVEQYHLRKMIIMLVVMALLVNFSFPITRFVIDFSNSAMYFLAENLQGSAAIAKFTNFGGMLQEAVSDKSSISSLILTIVFLFIIICTIFGIAINLLIRILAFALLIVISPAGFVFAFFPGTKKMSNEWWDALFKYAFMGPAMMFFLYLAVLMFDINNSVDYSKIKGSLAGNFVAFIVPVAFLWMGMIAAGRFGGEGSAMAMNFARKTRDKIKGYGQKAAWGTVGMVGKGADTMTGHRISGIAGGLKSKWDSYGEDYKSKSNKRKTEWADRFGVEGANEKLVQQTRKEWKEAGGVSDSEMARIDSKKGTKAEKMALALERAENKGFDKDPVKAAAQYQEALTALKGNKVYKDLFDGNIRKKNIDLEITANISEEMTKQGRSLYENEVEAIAKKSFDKLEPGNWKDQNIERIVAANKMYGHDGVVKAAKHRIDEYAKKDKVTETMRGDKYATGKSAGLWA